VQDGTNDPGSERRPIRRGPCRMGTACGKTANGEAANGPMPSANPWSFRDMSNDNRVSPIPITALVSSSSPSVQRPMNA
jgi:hypothetical protein